MREPIAIVGMGGIFPGAASLDDFWRDIINRKDQARLVPRHRWILPPEAALADSPAPDKVYSLRGCFVDGVALTVTDLGVDETELSQLDPLYRLALAAGGDAFRDGRTGNLDRSRVGVILAAIALPTDGSSAITRELLGRAFRDRLFGEIAGPLPLTQEESARDREDEDGFVRVPAHPLSSRVTGLPAAIIARALKLGGAAYTLDAACASSLYALKLACDELHEGRADAMLAGGVSRPDCLYTQMGFSQLRALSRSGRCSPFDERSDGLLVGEGAGLVLLKRLDDAVRDGDRVYAVIRGIGLSNDIGGSLLAPDEEGQLRAMRQAYEQAGWSPDDVDLIECHGTGTPVGDAVEISSLRALWCDVGGRPGGCPIGSVKSNIGHLLTAAGAAGLIKTLLAMRHHELPPSANFERPAKIIPLAGSPFRVQTRAEPWPRRDGRTPRRAAVSAFGFGGINAHVLLEECGEDAAGNGEQGTGNRARGQGPKPLVADPPGRASHLKPSIAIIGMDARFGRLANLREFDEAIINGGSALVARPTDRWYGLDEPPSPDSQISDLKSQSAGAYLNEVTIPVGKYRIPPHEITSILPQQLLMLESVAAALTDAGMPLRQRRPRVGVIIGMALDFETTNYHLRWWLESQAPVWARRLGLDWTSDERVEWLADLRDAVGPALDAPRVLGALGSIAASRIARECQFGGPSLTVSCDEASGLKALEIASRMLQRGEIDAAVVGAVDLAGDVRAVLCAEALRGPSSGGASIVGEGAAAVVLKREGDARRDGDRTYAILRSFGAASSAACAHDGNSSPASVAARRAREAAGVESDEATIDESDSVASVIGATGAATGLASLVFAALRLSRDQSGSPSDHIGVSAATANGNAMHVILESAPAHSPARRARAASPPADKSSSRRDCVVVKVGGRFGPIPMPRASNQSRDRKGAPPTPSWQGCHSNHEQASSLRDHAIDNFTTAPATIAEAHNAFLRFSQTATEGMARVLELQSRLFERAVAMGDSQAIPQSNRPQREAPTYGAIESNSALPHGRGSDQGAADQVAAGRAPLSFDRAQCLEFARGRIATVLGPDYAIVDTYPVRVRLPDEPLMLVDRILAVEGVRRSLTSGRLITEHDVLPGAWYLDGGRCPICITVEAGQADLFLSSYLGIDFVAKGVRAYRLLDATVTFHRGLPRPRETIRYDIRIDRFVRQGETYMFFFEFDGTIDDSPVLTMRNGCAGFFTKEEIENSQGIVLTADDLSAEGAKASSDFKWPVQEFQNPIPGIQDRYDASALSALRNGDLAGCFGPPFDRLNLRHPLRLPDGMMRLIDRILELDPHGGRFGLGRIITETDVHPDDWYLTCHFVDDMVMPGTLMYECCAHTLRFFLLAMGWVGEADEVCYEPIPGVASSLKCRGPVTPRTRKAAYEIEIKEAGYRPEPYVLADALMYADGKRIVQMKNMSLQLSGLTREKIDAVWNLYQSRARKEAPRNAAAHDERLSSKATPPAHAIPQASSLRPQVYTREHILAFATGKPSEAFGERYKPFDKDRFIARLPGPPYSFIDRITPLAGEAWRLQAGAEAQAEYLVPPDAWYFTANRQSAMPYAVLLEIALQPCGWLAAFCGSALLSDGDLHFRNLGGTATLHHEVFPDSGTLTTRVKLSSVSRAGGMIIEHFDMSIRCGDRPIYEGTTMFGFFSTAALAQQVGIRDAASRLWTPSPPDLAAANKLVIPDVAPWIPEDAAAPQVSSLRSEASLPARAFRMIDEIDCLLPGGGPHGVGFIRGVTTVDPDAWFFKAHFYQDPVWPGSLGLEAFLQLLKVYALNRWPDLAAMHRFEPIAVGQKHTWAYRGQVLPTNKRVEVQASITKRIDGTEPRLIADGFLGVDGVIIYEMTDFGIQLVSIRDRGIS
jgi:3-oxoacyl-(acyl-carrier-protein) synthase/3-hydroxymyristoyl/3-hydroxydecanoyl-(acyl carrier protein) dehydratase